MNPNGEIYGVFHSDEGYGGGQAYFSLEACSCWKKCLNPLETRHDDYDMGLQHDNRQMANSVLGSCKWLCHEQGML